MQRFMQLPSPATCRFPRHQLRKPALVVILLSLFLCMAFPASGMEVNVDCAALPPVEVFLYTKFDAVAVRKVQECLRRNGYYAGPINGLKNPLTLAALSRAYGRSHQGNPGKSPSDDTEPRKTEPIKKDPPAKALPSQKNAAKTEPSKEAVPKKGAATGSGCDHLPTRDEFIKNDYDKETIKEFQECLRSKGLFTAPVHGIKGPLTIRAFEKLDALRSKPSSGMGI